MVIDDNDMYKLHLRSEINEAGKITELNAAGRFSAAKSTLLSPLNASKMNETEPDSLL